MKTPNLDVDPFIEALRVDLPSADDEARVRARLLAAGVVVAGAAVTTSSGAASFAAGSVGSGTIAAVPGALKGAAVSGALKGAAVSGAPNGAGVAGAVVSGAAASGAAASGAAASGAAASAAAASAAAASCAAMSAAAGGGSTIGGLGAAGAPAFALKLGLFSKVLVLPMAAKVGVAATLAVAVAATSVPLVLSSHESEPGAGASAMVSRGIPRDRTAPVAPASRAPIADTRAVDGAHREGVGADSSSPALGVVGSDEVTASGTATGDANDEAGSRATATGGVSPLPDRRQTMAAARTSDTDRPSTRSRAASRLSKTGSRRIGARSESAAADPERSAAKRSLPRDVGSVDRGRTEMVHSSTLGEETRLLEQAMLALGAGDRSLARRSLEEHERRFPDGLLVRERERALDRLRQLAAEPH
jgi:hypothetical protein